MRKLKDILLTIIEDNYDPDTEVLNSEQMVKDILEVIEERLPEEETEEIPDINSYASGYKNGWNHCLRNIKGNIELEGE